MQMAKSDPWRVELVERDGVIRCEVTGYDDWVEPICPTCNEPIRWVLDMMSFTTKNGGVFTMTHARCAWTPEGFDTERELAARAQQ